VENWTLNSLRSGSSTATWGAHHQVGRGMNRLSQSLLDVGPALFVGAVEVILIAVLGRVGHSRGGRAGSRGVRRRLEMAGRSFAVVDKSLAEAGLWFQHQPMGLPNRPDVKLVPVPLPVAFARRPGRLSNAGIPFLWAFQQSGRNGKKHVSTRFFMGGSSQRKVGSAAYILRRCTRACRWALQRGKHRPVFPSAADLIPNKVKQKEKSGETIESDTQ